MDAWKSDHCTPDLDMIPFTRDLEAFFKKHIHSEFSASNIGKGSGVMCLRFYKSLEDGHVYVQYAHHMWVSAIQI